MGNLISTFLSSSKGNSTAQITDCSIWCPRPGQHISIRTFRELNRAPMSNPTSRKTGTVSNGDCSRLTEEVLEADSRHQTTQLPRH
ncbi:AC4 [Potato yellow mosaic virus-[Guadeloupe]]|uniref:Protein AC4 n=1 Tax=Potato yellow mosaic virus (isolate Venezuela) TaxID=223310 RepID=AC4_PYMVV|nr:RecName: Full=Protein AC4; AltName: Full=Protein AL4 [Potato yellow mosaic virus - [Venezuela]]AAM78603.1 AC4 [Potato yellow mosaic virus-[Guadeloupe]]